MDDQRFLKTVGKVLTDNTIIPLQIDIISAWYIVSGLQLATRHPQMGDAQREMISHIALQFQSAIVELHPAAEEVLDMGWNADYDV